MSGSYQPVWDQSLYYGEAQPALLNVEGLRQPSPLDNPRTLSLPAASPFENVTEGALATLLNPEGDSMGQPTESIAHPNPSLGAALGSAVMGLGLMSPMGFFGVPAALALSREMGMAPTFSLRSVGLEALGRGLAGLTSQDMTAMGLENAPPGTGATVGGWGLTNDGSKDGGGAFGGSKGGVDVGENAPGPSPSPDKGDANDEGGSKDNLASGGLIDLAGGGKIAMGLGGGLDDLIPTTIAGRKAARLSDGEFVIPADVVSMMGDGSSAAGSKRLYDMMKAIRQEKTGTARQAGPLEIGETLRRIFK